MGVPPPGLLAETHSVEILLADGKWYLTSGGPDEPSARATCRLLWDRHLFRGVRLVVSRREVLQEKRR